MDTASTRPRWLWAAIVLSGLMAFFVVSARSDDRPAPEPRGDAPVEERGAPHLRAPAVPAVARDDAQPKPPPGGCRIALVAAESRKPIAGARWRISRHGRSVVEGTSDAGGIARLSARAVDAWEQNRLKIWAEGRRDETFVMPEDARDGAIEIALEKFHVDFSGTVVDGAGRPLVGAHVVVEYWNHMSSISVQEGDLSRTTTGADGTFRLSAKVWYPDTEGIDGHVLWAGAPGFVPARVAPDKRGESNLVLRLARDVDGGVVEVHALRPDGTPAQDADLWIEGVPERPAVRHYAELWRGPTDARPPGFETWTRIGDRDTWWHRLDADGACTVGSLAPGTRRLQILAGDSATDLAVDVVAGPNPTRVEVVLEPLRTVAGALRVAQDPSWHCEHEAHEHVVLYDGWPEPPTRRNVASGAFELTDLPVGVTSMTIVTAGHPHVVVPLSAEGAAAVGEVLVPSARTVDGLLRWPAGRKPESWSGVRVVDREGTLTEATTFYTSDGGPFFRLVLPRRPEPDAWIVVRLRMRDGDRSKEVRLDEPHDLTSGRPLDLALPSSVPGRGD